MGSIIVRFTLLLVLIFVVAKLWGKFDVSWWLVFSPILLLVFLVVFSGLLVLLILIIIFGVIKWKTR